MKNTQENTMTTYLRGFHLRLLKRAIPCDKTRQEVVSLLAAPLEPGKALPHGISLRALKALNDNLNLLRAMQPAVTKKGQ